MKKMKFTLAAFLLLLLAPGVRAQNLVQNGSAELYDGVTFTANSWVIDLGNWVSQDHVGYTDTAYAGTRIFYAGDDTLGILHQDVDVSAYAVPIDHHSEYFDFSTWVQSFDQGVPSDETVATVSCLNANKTQTLYTWQSDTVYSISVWMQLAKHFKAPPGTRYIRIELKAIRLLGAANDGYFDAVSLTPITVTGVENAPEADLFKLAPNPAGNTISIALKNAGEHHVMVTDILGRTMLKKDIEQTGNVDITSLPAGHYILQVYTNDYESSQKMQFIKL